MIWSVKICIYFFKFLHLLKEFLVINHGFIWGFINIGVVIEKSTTKSESPFIYKGSKPLRLFEISKFIIGYYDWAVLFIHFPLIGKFLNIFVISFFFSICCYNPVDTWGEYEGKKSGIPPPIKVRINFFPISKYTELCYNKSDSFNIPLKR